MTEEVEILEADVILASSGGTALVTQGSGRALTGLLRPIAAPAEVLAVQNETRALIEKALEEGRDYGVIPGTQRPTLYKPGAERVNAAFGMRTVFEVMEKEIDHDHENHFYGKYDDKTGPPSTSYGLYRYVVLCRLIHRETGQEVGQGVGSCSTLETKYISRPRDSENTTLKMAKKRALIDATLSAFGLSDQFTQDVEDFRQAGGGDEPTAALTDNSIMPFGKHKGVKLGEVPRSYFEWALENMEKLDPTLRAYAEKRLAPDPVAEQEGTEALEQAALELELEGLEGLGYDAIVGQLNVAPSAEMAMRIMHTDLPMFRSQWGEFEENVAADSARKFGARLFNQAAQAVIGLLEPSNTVIAVTDFLELIEAADKLDCLEEPDRGEIEACVMASGDVADLAPGISLLMENKLSDIEAQKAQKSEPAPASAPSAPLTEPEDDLPF